MTLPVTQICRDLGIRYPIFGFSHEPDVVVAIVRAGGFGVLGLGRELPEDIPAIIERVETALAGQPYGLDLMLPQNVPTTTSVGALRQGLSSQHLEFVADLTARYGLKPPTHESFFTRVARSETLFEQQIEQVLASRATVVATAIGIRPDLIRRARSGGKYTVSLVGAPEHARKALGLGVDALVAQGYDAGGHTGPIGTFSLVPQIVRIAGGRPVLAAGGIATGSQLIAALAMGAQGAWLGTLWMAAEENHTPPALLRRLIEGRSTDTLITRAHSGKPCRVIRSEWIDAWETASAPTPLPMPMQQALVGEAFAAMHEHDDPRLIYEAAGQSVFGITQETTVARQIGSLVSEAEQSLQSLRAISVF